MQLWKDLMDLINSRGDCMKDIIIIGAGGFGREVAWLIEDINKVYKEWNIVGFIDEKVENKGRYLNGYKILGNFSEVTKVEDDLYYICAVGNPEAKKQLVQKAEELGLRAATLIHPSVVMSKHVSIGEGTIICAGNIITVNIKIGNHVIVNLDCTIGHDVLIEDCVTILPSANISGNVKINQCCDIGTGCAIIQGKTIGKNSVIGAGAVVVKDIPDNCVAVGCPAKIIKEI